MKTYLCFLLLLFSIYKLPAQPELERQVISAGGTNMEAGDLSLVSTIGEFLTETHEGNFFDLFITQGFHQEALFIVSTYEFDNEFTFEVFPNPTSESLYISADADENLSIEIVDLLGRSLATQELTSPIQKSAIPVSDLAAGQYFLKISNTDGHLIFAHTFQKINQ